MSLGDLNRDGQIEYFFSLLTENYIAILEQATTQLFPIIIEDNAELGSQKGVAVGDIDLDGSLDVVVTFVGGNVGLGWMKYDVSPFLNDWTWQTIYSIQGGKFDQPILYDVDQDGDLDILTTEEKQGLGVIWFENPTID